MAHRGRAHNFGEVILRSLAQGLVSGQQGLLFDLENRRQTEQADRLFGLEQQRLGLAERRVGLAEKRAGTQEEQFAQEFGEQQRQTDILLDLRRAQTAEIQARTAERGTPTSFEELFISKIPKDVSLDDLSDIVTGFGVATGKIKPTDAGQQLFGKGLGTEIGKQFFKSRLEFQTATPEGGRGLPTTELVQPPITPATMDSLFALLSQAPDKAATNSVDFAQLQQRSETRQRAIDWANQNEPEWTSLSAPDQEQFLQQVEAKLQ